MTSPVPENRMQWIESHVSTLELLGLPTQVIEILQNHRVKTIKDLLLLSRKEFLEIPNLGGGRLDEVYRALSRGGITVPMRWRERDPQLAKQKPKKNSKRRKTA